MLGIITLTEHDGRPYVALGTYEHGQATGARYTAQLTVGEQTRGGPALHLRRGRSGPAGRHRVVVPGEIRSE